MVQKFEVGKLYKSSSAGSVVECLWHDDKDALVRVAGGKPIVVSARTCQNYKEYHEPVVVKAIRAVIQNKDGGLCTPRLEFVHPNDNMTGKIEVTVIDGKLTDVRIL